MQSKCPNDTTSTFQVNWLLALRLEMSGFTAQSPWSLHYTEEGQPYYYNSITYETQWNDPASAEIVGSAGPDSTEDFEADVEDLEPDACEFKIGLLFELEKKKFFLFRSSEDELYSSSMKKVAEKLQVPCLDISKQKTCNFPKA